MERKKLNIILIIMILFSSANGQIRQIISLDGEWEFAIDSTQIGIDNSWEKGIPSILSHSVTVPNT